MTISATNLISTVLRQLTNNGQAVTVTRDNIGSYAVSTGTVTDSADTTFTGYGYPDNYNKFFVASGVVKATDIKMYFYSSTQPVVDDIFTFGGVSYTAVEVQHVTLSGADVLYIVQLRK